MNKKGFTTVEIVVSFALIVIILTSMISIVVNYRDKVTNEEVKTQLLDFKNTITKVIYDDITNEQYSGLARCTDNDLCVKFIKKDGGEENLNIIVSETTANGLTRGIYFEYRGIKYFLPDSDLNDYLNADSTKYAVNVNELIFNINETNSLYSVKIPIYHRISNEEMIINLVIS